MPDEAQSLVPWLPEELERADAIAASKDLVYQIKYLEALERLSRPIFSGNIPLETRLSIDKSPILEGARTAVRTALNIDLQ